LAAFNPPQEPLQSGEAYIRFRDVTKTYKVGEITIPAADGISFDIDKGEFVVVVGPSGAGKTTVLNMLGGMDSCNSGEIIVDGEHLENFGSRQLTEYRRFDTGFVFQFYNLIQNLTALENVEMAAQVCKDSADSSEILDKVGLAHRKDNFPSQLSGGEQQRVAIARALAKRPKLLLCDEPTGALDSKTGRTILELLQKTCREENMTVVLITHNAAITPIGDRVIRMKNGKAESVTLNPHPANVADIEW
jgi:putative ABC transport system ATP-binding protein